ncbi:MAG: Fic family protein [Alphaproteobacteria bacterium]|nr:Fic family protein [Alphaproteobacteria bacterium]
MKNKRHSEIIDVLLQNSDLSAQNILSLLPQYISKITLLRDLDELISLGFVKRHGIARATKYFLTQKGKILREFDLDQYFKNENRNIAFPIFNFNIFQNLLNLFDSAEVKDLYSRNTKFEKNFKTLPDIILKKELERLTIEFCWKSSHIEGNTYTLLDTERLLKFQTLAIGHPNEEATMIINHKNAMEFIYKNIDLYKKITISKIEDLHKIIVDNLNVSTQIRQVAVGITGTEYKPLDNKYQLKEVLEKTCDLINSTRFPLEKALIAVAMISYIQPFEDGNKRTARLIGNAILLANNFSPLSYKNVDEVAYKAALIIFYEQNSLGNFKKLFVSQYINALEKYF